MEKLIELSEVTKVKKKDTIIDSVTFNLNKGEIYGLLGPNGAGKTTLMRMIVGLVRPTSGKIKVCGYNIENEKIKVLENIGAAIEPTNFYPYLSGRENLNYLAKFSNTPDINFDEIIHFTDIGNAIDKKTSTYSMGMIQRLRIAQALLNDPQVLILDEPTNGLDPQGISDLREYLKKLAHKNKISILISSHLLSEMSKICDKISIIDKGKIIYTEEISQSYDSHTYSLQARPLEKAKKLLEDDFQLSVLVENNELSFNLSTDTFLEIVDNLKENEIEILNYNKRRSSLEDRYFGVTKS